MALAGMEGGPVRPAEVVGEDDYILCELGEHGESTEHGAHLWTADTPEDRDLWYRWAGTGAHRVHRLDVLPTCPALQREIATGTVTLCGFFDHHTGPHSFSVTDPLGELITDRIHHEIRRLTRPDTTPGNGEEP